MKYLIILLLCAQSFAQIISGATISGGATAGVPSIQITNVNPPPGKIGVVYGPFSFTSAGGALPIQGWTCQQTQTDTTACVLPSGLALNPATGKLSGTPTTAGTYPFTIVVKDFIGIPALHDYIIQIPQLAGPQFVNAVCPVGAVGTAYSCQLTASGGVLPYAWSILPGPANVQLPAGLSLSPTTGLINGTPLLAGGVGTFAPVVQVMDANHLPAQAQVTIIIPNPPSPVIQNAIFPNGTVNTPYNFDQQASGGSQPYTWTTSQGACVSGGVLPTGLTLNAATGQVIGTPIVAGTYCFTETVTDLIGKTDFQLYNVVISPQLTQGAQLPTSWVKSWECYGTMVHNVTLGTLTQAGLNALVVAAVAQRDSDGSGTLITVPHGTLLSGTATLTLLGSNTSTGNNSNNCIGIDSDTPPTIDQTVCSVGVRESQRNPFCTNDIAKLWTWQQSSSANPVLGTNPGSSGPAHHYWIKGYQFLDDPAGTTRLNGVALAVIGTQAEALESQQPNHLHFAYGYYHGSDTPDISAGRGAFYSCHDCSWMWNYTDRIHFFAKEGQVFATQQASRIKFGHNWIEGGSEGIFVGGAPPAISAYNPSDFEVRGNISTLDYGWVTISNCTTHVWTLKNRIEFKNMMRAAVVGNLFTNSWCDGQTAGALMLLNVRALSTQCPTCTGGNNTTVKDISVFHNIFAHASQGIQTDAASGGTGNSGTAGFGQSLKGQNWDISGNLTYDIGDDTRFPAGSVAKVGLALGASTNSLICSAARDGAGAVATLTCATQLNVPGTGMTTGDPVKVTACDTGDQGFITGLSLPYVVATSATPTGLTVVYPNPGAASGTATGCHLDNSAGYPNYVTYRHNSYFGANNAGNSWVVAEGQSPSFQYPRNNSFTDNIWATNGGNPGGWSSSAKAEGNATEQMFDTGTLHFNNNLLTGRKATSYTGYQPGEPALSFPGNGAGLGNNQTGIICGAIPTPNCIAFLGGMNNVPYTSNPTDYHVFALRSDSNWAAGQPGDATDNTDLGASIAAIDADIDSTQFTCATACGTGPFSDLTPFVFATGTGNNTAASSGTGVPTAGNYAAFAGLSTDAGNTNAQTQVIEPAPVSTSTVSIAKYMYPGFSGDVWCEVQPWWTHGSFGHVDIGQDLANTALITAKVAQMKKAGCTVVWIDYYASNVDSGFEVATTARYATAIAAQGLKLEILYDQGSFKAGCPQGATDQTACIIAKMNTDLDAVNSAYFAQSYYLKSSTKPVLSFFVTESLWSGTNWSGGGGVWETVRTHTNAYNSGAGVLFIHRFGSFSHVQSDGQYAWVQPAVYVNASSTSQFCWDDTVGGSCNPATGVGGGVSYLATFYAACQANITKLCIGAIWPGFDWSNSGYTGGVQKVASRIYGQVLGLTAAKAQAAGYNAAKPLYALGVVTWDDYGEGTGVEPGIDNGWSVTLNSTAGGTASWSFTKADGTYVVSSTIDHIEVFAKDASNNTFYVHSNLPATATSLSGMSGQLVTGTAYTIYVRLVGKPMIENKLSNGVAYTP